MQGWQMTHSEFQSAHAVGDFDPELIQDGWVCHVSDAIKASEPVTYRVLLSNGDIRFDSHGNAFYTQIYLDRNDLYAEVMSDKDFTDKYQDIIAM